MSLGNPRTRCRLVQAFALGSREVGLLTVKKAPVLKAIFLGAVLAIRFLLFAETSLAADAECSSDSGIPNGVIAPIDVEHSRKALADAGFTVGGFYLGETFANTGGIRQGETYDGVFWTYLLGDLHKAGLWKGLCFYTDAYQIHGRSITADDIGSLATVSNYEALPSTRLSELWLEQHLFNDHLTVRVGQLTADTEFLLSKGGSNFFGLDLGLGHAPPPPICPVGARPIRSPRPACAYHLSRMITGALCSACTTAIPPALTARAILKSATITVSTSDSIRRRY
jgi:carbohydrate-selective porin OprB